jgi:hypothetical protein
VAYPNIAKFKATLDGWAEELWEEERVRRAKAPRIEQAAVRLVPSRVENPPQGHFANVFVPASDPRYSSLCEWAKTADPKFWKFGQSSDNRSGIWIPVNVWEEGVSASRRAATFTVPTPDALRKHYERHGLSGEPKVRVWNETEDEHDY